MTFKCSHCATTLDAPDLKPGDLCECPNCSKTVEVPFPKIKGHKLTAVRRRTPDAGAAGSPPDLNQAVLQEMRAQTDHLASIRWIAKLFVWLYIVLPLCVSVLLIILHILNGEQ